MKLRLTTTKCPSLPLLCILMCGSCQVLASINRQITSMGKDFWFVVGQVDSSHQRESLDVFALILTSSQVTNLVQAVTKHLLTHSSESAIVKVKPTELTFLNISTVSQAVQHGENWTDLAFRFFSEQEFSLTVVVQQGDRNVYAFMVLPLEYWTTDYACFGISNNLTIIAVNLYWPNELYVYCSLTETTERVSRMHPLQVEYIKFCKESTRNNSYVGGVSLSGSSIFGVFTMETFETQVGGCKEKDIFVNQEMTMTADTFGTDFISIDSLHPSQPGDLLVMALYSGTVVEVFWSSVRTLRSYTIHQPLQTVQIPAVYGGCRVTSGGPVQIIFVSRPTCSGGRRLVGETTPTVLMPHHLLYNEYNIGSPELPGVNSTVAVILHILGQNSLTLNGSLARTAFMWRSVIGKSTWTYGIGRIDPNTVNHIKCDLFFACYIYVRTNSSSYIQTAGYKACWGMTSEPLKPDDCKRRRRRKLRRNVAVMITTSSLNSWCIVLCILVSRI